MLIFTGILLTLFQNPIPPQQLPDVVVTNPGHVVRVSIPSKAGDKPTALTTNTASYSTQLEPIAWDVNEQVVVWQAWAETGGESQFNVQWNGVQPKPNRLMVGDFARSVFQTGITLTGEDVRMHGYTRRGQTCATRYFTSQHSFGWITIVDGYDAAFVDLVFHDEVQGGWTFQPISIGPGEATTVMVEPTVSGNQLLTGGYLPYRGRREFRVALVAGGGDTTNHDALVSARAYLSGQGWGVSRLWQTIPAWGPAQALLPSLSHLKNNAQRVSAEWASISQAVQAGTGYGPASTSTKYVRIGDLHPCGTEYGGVTGGAGIWKYWGMVELDAGLGQGLLYARQISRLSCDRNYIGSYDQLGNPWIPPGYRVMATNGLWVGQKQVGPTAAWMPDDWQHGRRNTYHREFLAWADGDDISRHEFQMLATLYADTLQTLTAGAEVTAKNYPHTGLYWGRAEGWGLTTMCSAWALTEPDKRNTLWLTLLDRAAAVLVKTQTNAGMNHCETQGKQASQTPFNGQYGVCQTIEQGILTHAMQCLAVTVGVQGQELDTAILRSVREGMLEFSFDDAARDCWRHVAVRPVAQGSTPFEGVTPAHVAQYDSWQVWAPAAYALARHPDDLLLRQRVKQLCKDSTSCRTYLENRYYDNIEDRAPLLAVVRNLGM